MLFAGALHPHNLLPSHEDASTCMNAHAHAKLNHLFFLIGVARHKPEQVGGKADYVAFGRP